MSVTAAAALPAHSLLLLMVQIFCCCRALFVSMSPFVMSLGGAVRVSVVVSVVV